jgi:hypothetical protein
MEKGRTKKRKDKFSYSLSQCRKKESFSPYNSWRLTTPINVSSHSLIEPSKALASLPFLSLSET